jgi:hypothetical protein
MLARMFQPDSMFAPPLAMEDGAIFLDRDPDAFGIILNYLRHDCKLLDDPTNGIGTLRAEADFFGLVHLVNACDAIQAQRSKGEQYEVIKVSPATFMEKHYSEQCWRVIAVYANNCLLLERKIV